jgi:hypothetical protein
MAISGAIEKLKPNINNPAVNAIVTPTAKAVSTLSSFDTDSISKDSISNLLGPYLETTLIGIATSDETINLIVKEATSLLNRKGRIEIKDSIQIFFYPHQDGDWFFIEDQFNKKIDLLRNSLNKITEIVNIITKTISIVNKILTALNIYLQFREKLLSAQLIAAVGELASPSPSKPVTAQTISDLNTKLVRIIDLQNKIKDINEVLTSFTGTLQLVNNLLTILKIKLSQAKFTIVNSNNNFVETKNILVNRINEVETVFTLEETVNSSNNIKYIIKIIPLKDGFNKAAAYDSLSGLLITETAPSATKTPLELIDELKQILS